MLALPFIALVASLLLGVPVALALAGTGFLGIWMLTGSFGQAATVTGTTIYSSVSDYSLSTIPLFILMAFFASHGGIASDLYYAFSRWTSSIRGGLALATVAACGVFGAMSGASTAAASVMAKVAVPEMKKYGYSDALAGGSVAVGSTTDLLIPPSIGLVIYGLMTDTSIGDLLLAGVLPGVVLMLCLATMIVIWVTVDPSIAPATYSVPWRQRVGSVLRIWPSVLLIGAVMGLLYSGVATATEVGAVGAACAFAVSALLGRVTLVRIRDSFSEALSTTTMIFLIFVGAMIFGYFLTMSQIPQHLVTAIGDMQLNRWVVMVAIVVSYFVISMFMDELPLMLLTLPITFPVITSLGFDPVWYGIMTVLMAAMGMVFPPVGLLAFVVSGTSGINIGEVYKGCFVLILAIFATTALVMAFPQIALMLPQALK
jgi:tripartite ATP-independent transporter DctM subunit